MRFHTVAPLTQEMCRQELNEAARAAQLTGMSEVLGWGPRPSILGPDGFGSAAAKGKLSMAGPALVRGARTRESLARGAVLLLTLSLIGGLLAACHPVPVGYCADLPGDLDKWIWDGEAGTTVFETPQNWDHNGNSNVGYPGDRFASGDDDYVCIPIHKTVTINTDISAHLVALDNAGTLEVTPLGKLELKGDPATQPSYSHDLKLQGLLYGVGKVTVRSGGTLTWNHDPAAPGASTMSTRESGTLVPPFPTNPGRTVIAPGAKLVVDGLGVNLWDKRIIDNQGTTEITNDLAYIAADDGTTFRNTGTFDFKSDGDYVQGFLIGALGPPRFINTGLLRKSGGTGTSVVDASYTLTEGAAGPGSAEVSSGSLSILSNNTGASVAPVTGDATFATGGCFDPDQCVTLATTATNTQFSSLTLPGGTATSGVTMAEKAAENGVIGRPVELLVPAETADANNPMTFKLALDVTLLGPLDTHLNLEVYHGANLVPDCLPGPPQAECVDRAASIPVLNTVPLVIKTAANGRWKVRSAFA